VFITGLLWAGRTTVVQAQSTLDEFYVTSQRWTLAACVLRRNLGSKAIKMIYHTNPDRRFEFVKTVKGRCRRTCAFCITDAEVEEAGLSRR